MGNVNTYIIYVLVYYEYVPRSRIRFSFHYLLGTFDRWKRGQCLRRANARAILHSHCRHPVHNIIIIKLFMHIRRVFGISSEKAVGKTDFRRHRLIEPDRRPPQQSFLPPPPSRGAFC